MTAMQMLSSKFSQAIAELVDVIELRLSQFLIFE